MKYDNVYPYETKNGKKYMYRVKYYTADGKRHEKQKRGYDTARAAYRDSVEVLLAVEDNRLEELDMQTMTVNDAAKVYMEQNRDKWQPSTIDIKERSFATAHDSLGKMKVKNVNGIVFKKAMADLYPDLKPNAVETYASCFRALFTWLVDNDMLDKNRIQKITYGEKSSRNHIMAPDQIQHFLSVLESHKEDDPTTWYAFNFLLRTGCRRGELMALSWDDVSDDGKVHIHRTRRVDRVKNTTKTGEDRTIYMGKTLLAMHRYYLQYKRQQSLRTGQPLQPQDFIFTTDRLYRIPASLLGRKMRDIEDECGFDEHFTIHSLRHANATYSLSSDNNLKAVQTRLGHADSKTTMRFYVEDLDTVNKEYANSIDEFFNEL